MNTSLKTVIRDKPATVDDYIASFPSEIRCILEKIRETVRSAAPTATERLCYRMPTYRLDRDILHFGAFKGHIGLYPPVREAELQDRIAPYRGEKGNLRFRLDRPMPYELIADIVLTRAKRKTWRL
ncbi:MAG TPA: DUF1801 domain-containing protein [Caulobacteraceae bacterium]